MLKMKTPEQKQHARQYAAAYRKKNPTLPKTPEQMEKRRLWQIEYRKNKPIPKLTQEQKEVKAERQKANRLKLKEDRLVFVKARIAKQQGKAEERIRLRQEKAIARKEAKRIKDAERYKVKRMQMGLTQPLKRGRKTIPKPSPVRPKHKQPLRPLQKIRERERVLPTLSQDLSKLIKLHIPELRMDVFIRPDQDPEAVRQKYLSKRG